MDIRGGAAYLKPNYLKAKLALALTFFWHLLCRLLLFWKKRPGLETFLKYYAADSIYPISGNERAEFPSYQRCLACSLCTFSCVAIQQGTAPSGFEPKFILLGYGRSPHESEVFLEEWLPCYSCQTCQVLCPNQVPVHLVAERIMKRRNRLGFRRDPS